MIAVFFISAPFPLAVPGTQFRGRYTHLCLHILLRTGLSRAQPTPRDPIRHQHLTIPNCTTIIRQGVRLVKACSRLSPPEPCHNLRRILSTFSLRLLTAFFHIPCDVLCGTFSQPTRPPHQKPKANGRRSIFFSTAPQPRQLVSQRGLTHEQRRYLRTQTGFYQPPATTTIGFKYRASQPT